MFMVRVEIEAHTFGGWVKSFGCWVENFGVLVECFGLRVKILE